MLAVFGALMIGAPRCELDGPTLRVLIASGDPAPGEPGYHFEWLGVGGWNDRSELAFGATLRHDDPPNYHLRSTVWGPGPTGPQLLLEERQALPEIGPDAYYTGSATRLALGDGGDVVIDLPYREPYSHEGSAYAVARDGELDIVAWGWGPVPGAPDLVLEPYRLGYAGRVTSSGAFALVSEFQWPDGVRGEVLLAPGEDEPLVARLLTGDSVSGVPDAIWSGFSTRAEVDEWQRTTFRGEYQLPDGVTRQGLFRVDRRGQVAPLWVWGDQAPDLPKGAYFTRFGPNISISPTGLIATTGGVAGPGVTLWTNEGIWVLGGTWARGARTPRLVLRTGDEAPGLAEGFRVTNVYDPPLVNDSGAVVFHATVFNGVDGMDALYVDRGDGVQLIALEGDPVRGAPGWEVTSVGPIQINGPGDVLLGGGMKRASGETSSFRAIAPRDGGFLRLLGNGDVVELEPGSPRIVESVYPMLNDRRELMFDVKFTDGTFAVLCTGVPQGDPLRFFPSPCGPSWQREPRSARSSLDDLYSSLN